MENWRVMSSCVNWRVAIAVSLMSCTSSIIPSLVAEPMLSVPAIE